MNDKFQRTEILVGKEGLRKLKNGKILILGVGGVGGFCCEALVRAGLGTIDIVDKDKVDVTNLNRQIISTMDTIGKSKVEVMKDRMLSINPEIKCEAIEKFFLPENEMEMDFGKYDYIVDAVDTVSAKIAIVLKAQQSKVSVISSMGAGNKLHPEMFRVADIYETKVCPLAKVMRRELKKKDVKGLKVVYSEEIPIKNKETEGRVPGSISFVPSVVGLIIAGEVVRDLLGRSELL